MKIRFTAEIIEDNGRTEKEVKIVETEVPDITEYDEPSKFKQVFDQFEKPVIEARNLVATEIAKEYLERAAFLKGGEKESEDRN